jgi:hypothetical protein
MVDWWMARKDVGEVEVIDKPIHSIFRVTYPIQYGSLWFLIMGIFLYTRLDNSKLHRSDANPFTLSLPQLSSLPRHHHADHRVRETLLQ